MAIYHLHVKVIGRKAGSSAVASAAYRAASRMRDERIDRVQDFGIRFMDVESSMNDAVKKITRLKITTADSGASIITAARNLLKAGAKENKKKKSLADMDDSMFIEADATTMLPETNTVTTPQDESTQ